MNTKTTGRLSVPKKATQNRVGSEKGGLKPTWSGPTLEAGKKNRSDSPNAHKKEEDPWKQLAKLVKKAKTSKKRQAKEAPQRTHRASDVSEIRPSGITTTPFKGGETKGESFTRPPKTTGGPT